MATDQGKINNVLGLAIMAEIAGPSIPDTGTTIFRPPYTPVPTGAIDGRIRNKHFRPTRLTTSHQWAAEHGADFVGVGPWPRAQWFARSIEKEWRDGVDHEVQQTRNSVRVCDVCSLGRSMCRAVNAPNYLILTICNGILSLLFSIIMSDAERLL